MALEEESLLSCGGVPYPNFRAIVAPSTTDDARAVCADRHTANSVGVLLEFGEMGVTDALDVEPFPGTVACTGVAERKEGAGPETVAVSPFSVGQIDLA
jgi:hypothetical protein